MKITAPLHVTRWEVLLIATTVGTIGLVFSL
jgi:hypothetical protein